MGSYTSSIRMSDKRKRLYNHLEEATGRSTRVDALDEAARFYVEMAGGTTVRPTGAFEELLERAVDQGSVTPEEIAEVLDSDQLPVQADVEWSVGEKVDQ